MTASFLLYFDKVHNALFDQYIFNQLGHLGFIGSHFENIHVHRVLHITQIVSIHFIYGLPIRKMPRSVWKTTKRIFSVGHLGFIGSHSENIRVHHILHIPQIVSIHFIYGMPIQKMLRSV